MAVYNKSGEALASVYGADGQELLFAYDASGNVIFSKHEYASQIEDLENWLVNLATYTANGETYVKERYRLDTGAWVSGATAMACAQAALTYLYLWQYHSNTQYRTVARNLVTSLEKGRAQSGGFPMFIYDGHDSNIYTGGNSEVPISLFRMALIDTENASTYITNGLRSTDYLLSIQNDNGSWRTVTNDTSQTALFTAQAMTALAYGYQYTTNKSGYKTAIEKAADFIATQLLPDDRIRTCREVSPNTEYWRPPTSDQSIVVRGLAIAEYFLSDDADASDWAILRHTLLNYLDDCIGADGAVRNGLGTTNLPNDFYGLTDHVYTTSWAVEAYYYSALVDNSNTYMGIYNGILDFCANNLYFSLNQNANGVIRGAYNCQDNNWNTSALAENPLGEGGADMIYVGWVMSPLLTWMIKSGTN